MSVIHGLPKFSETFGISQEDMLNWSPEQIRELGDKDWRALLMFAYELRIMIAEMKSKLN